MKLFTIGEVAKQVNTSTSTIRYWTEEFDKYINFEIGKGDRKYYCMTFKSTREAGMVTGLKATLIAKCCCGEKRKYENFIWKYIL